jgi:hypothetical protein
MKQLALSHTFIEAMARLEPIGAKRVAAFLDKLLRDPDAISMHAEILHDVPDPSIHSLRISRDLRAVARDLGSELLLLFVGHHDDAYDWARAHCYGCEGPRAGLRISVEEIPHPQAQALGLLGSGPAGAWHCDVGSTAQLCRAFDAAGIDHGLLH